VLHRLSETLGDYAGFWPGVLVTLVVASLGARPVARRLGTSTVLGWALLASFGLILAATVTPSREAILFGAKGTGMCDLSRFGFAPLWDFRYLDEISLNVLLFMPLGICLGLLPSSRTKPVLIVLALLLSPAIELFQLVAVGLGRQCQSSDVFDNLTGLVPALLIGLSLRWGWDHMAEPAA
jgi:hypothetical protein